MSYSELSNNSTAGITSTEAKTHAPIGIFNRSDQGVIAISHSSMHYNSFAGRFQRFKVMFSRKCTAGYFG